MARIEALGIDVGSTTCKIVGISGERQMIWQLLEQTEPHMEAQVDRLLEHALYEIGDLDGIPLVATGYGRRLVKAATHQVTEISCHARGVYQALHQDGTLVDLGGQDSKVIRVGRHGKVVDFAMNDKCAAGTGRFLENTAGRLQVPLREMGETALSALEEVSISSTCTVFAESEVISLIAQGVQVPSILRGLHRSLVRRIVSMIRTVGLSPPLMLSGGVVQNPAIRHMLAEETGEQVILPSQPQLMGAYGAGLFARELK